MRIPYVIDNQGYRLADLLNQLLAGHTGKSLDVATAYFNIQGFRLLKAGLDRLGSFRLLLGDEPEEGAAIGLRPKEPKIVRGLWGDIEKAPFTEEISAHGRGPDRLSSPGEYFGPCLRTWVPARKVLALLW